MRACQQRGRCTHHTYYICCYLCHTVTYCVKTLNLSCCQTGTSQVLSQIQNFDNLIVPVVDSLKYLSPLGYDMLSCIH